MAIDSPSPPQNKKATTRTPSQGREAEIPQDITPARAIAEAWIKESKESQDKWKDTDAKLKDTFNHTNRPVPLGRRAKM
jgi:hypothetical protein